MAVKWFKRDDEVLLKIVDEKTQARLELDPRYKSVAAPKGQKGTSKKSEREQLGDDLDAAKKAELEAEQKIRDDAAKANQEAKDIKEAEEDKKGVSKDVPLTTDKRVKKE